MDGPDIFVINLCKATEQAGYPICNIGIRTEQRYMRHFLHAEAGALSLFLS